ncbi:hypothetical protein [Candidatus Magnetomonas plexicatena]|uniref:hypothetical protein n=1 Tax=Candidatus Magnetomonas plexicatena TaxID=2552947 RepID=UPI001C74507F|nr:hypothetical protein E2O03_004480 [Nitrospirales bacterium LBB_01]
MKEPLSTGKLPERSLNWLASSRLKFINEMRDGKSLRYFSAHLPVMITWVEGGESEPYTKYPVNMTVKGIGLIPKTGQLEHFTNLFESAAANTKSRPHIETIRERVEAVEALYNDPSNFDPALLGGLEIFSGKALQNVKNNGHTSLLYVGMEESPAQPMQHPHNMAQHPHGMGGHGGGISYISFQVNGSIEILEKDNVYYRYLLASRKLFEFDKFHIFQPDYPFGYLIKVEEVHDKSPWSRAAK